MTCFSEKHAKTVFSGYFGCMYFHDVLHWLTGIAIFDFSLAFFFFFFLLLFDEYLYRVITSEIYTLQNLLSMGALYGLNPYKVGLFWRFLWRGGRDGQIPPLHNFGTINDDFHETFPRSFVHQQCNKFTSSFFDHVIIFQMWRHHVCYTMTRYIVSFKIGLQPLYCSL